MPREDLHSYYQQLHLIATKHQQKLRNVLVDTEMRHLTQPAEKLSSEGSSYFIADALLATIAAEFGAATSIRDATKVIEIYRALLVTFFGNP